MKFYGNHIKLAKQNLIYGEISAHDLLYQSLAVLASQNIELPRCEIIDANNLSDRLPALIKMGILILGKHMIRQASPPVSIILVFNS